MTDNTIVRHAVMSIQRDNGNLITSGMIPAIRMLRSITGLGLKEAKDQVDAWILEDSRESAQQEAEAWQAEMDDGAMAPLIAKDN